MIFNKLFDMLKLDNTYETESRNKEIHIPKYCAGLSWTQDSYQSKTTSDGSYDMKNFSKHEIDTIRYVLSETRSKYPAKYRSLGFVNENYVIKYKARYILYEMAIIIYEKSTDPIDKFAVSLAYASKGAYFRQQAISYFESSAQYISDELLSDFSSYMPLHVYNMFSELYEKEHEYQKSIYYVKKAKEYGYTNNPYFDNRISILLKKQSKNTKKQNRKMPESQCEFEHDVNNAAKYFLRDFGIKTLQT